MKKILIALLYLLVYTNAGFAQREEFIQATDSAKQYKEEHHLKDVHNSYVDNDNVIHIFMFQDGNLLLKGYPTMATEKNKFQLHLFVTSDNDDDFIMEYEGNYLPMYDGFASRGFPATIKRIDFAILGPFTSKLTLTLKRKKKTETIFSAFTTMPDIQISKTIYASIGSGLIYSSLKNPGNIRAVPIAGGGDSTLIADDGNGRGMITIMATFYPWGRNNLMVPSWSFRDRFGILVGTGIATSGNNFENFFFGGQFDFSVGGSFVTGIHYGRRQQVLGVNYKDFTFGQSKFTGELQSYSRWDFGFFIGVQVDSRIFSKLFPNSAP